MQHLPSFIEKAEEIKGKGVDSICCLSVNDFFVMKKWMEGTTGAADSGILFLADGGAVLTQVCVCVCVCVRGEEIGSFPR